MTYDYHPKDAEYLKQHGLHWIPYYIDRIVACHKIGTVCWVDGVQKAYQMAGSTMGAGNLLGVSQRCINYHMRRINPSGLRGRGGLNKPPAKTFIGKVCRSCGSTERYQSTGGCRPCNIRRTREWHERKSNAT